MIRWIIFVLVYLLIDWYAFQSIRTVTRNHWIFSIYIAISIVVVGNFIFQFLVSPSTGATLTPERAYAFGFLIALIVFKLGTLPFLFGEDVVRFIAGVYRKFFGKKEIFHVPTRRTFVSGIALGVAAIPFAALLYGMYKGKYNFKVLRYTLEFDDLPPAFDGYKITQLSDIHSGSFDNKKAIEYAVDLVNKQASDVIFFTGDMVNNKALEMEPWMATFSRLRASDGKFSILGNHDYGDYAIWDSEEDKIANLERLKDIQHQIGFDLLLNESRYLKKGEDKIALIGVENWGAGRFRKSGDLKKAVSGIHKDDFKILMSHDPSHWEHKVIKDNYHYHLTLSGHTHGMQFGIEIPGWIKWSPIKWRYKYWAGIYKEMGQYINVNRGFGYIGYPGRVGIWPEITVIELKKSTKIS